MTFLCRGHQPSFLLASCSKLLLLVWLLAPGCSTALETAPVKSLLQEKAFVAWEEAVYKAAEAALTAVSKQSGAELSLRDVPLDTLQVYTGRQHQIGLSVDGIQYDVVLGAEQEWLAKQHRQAAAALPEQGAPTSDAEAVSSSLVAQHWQAQGAGGSSSGGGGAGALPPVHELALPDVTLSGPLELLLPTASQVAFYIPHQADAGAVRRIQLAAGVTVRLSNLKSIQLRRTLDLPSLPVGYLAEVYAHAKLGDGGAGFNKAAGVRYLAGQLRSLALNATLPLLSFEVVPASEAAGLVVRSQEEAPGAPPPRLKLKRGKHDTVELSLRQGQIVVSDADSPSAVVQRARAAARPWAWPLPHVDMSSLVPYEALLRSILASHPFDLMKVQKQGISLKVTKSEIRAARLMAFEMEVRSSSPPPALPEGLDQLAGSGEETADGGWGLKPDNTMIMVFDVTVSVREKPGAVVSGVGGVQAAPELVYVPISVKLREVHGATVTLSQATLQAMLQGGGNGTMPVPLGYDHHDMGIAQQEAE